MKYPFEDFLKEKHASQCEGVMDDDMTDDFDNWLTALDQEELIGYGNQALNLALSINKK